MVTAIVVPILIVYFYWVTKKEAKKQKERWKNLTKVPSESRLEGKILFIHTEKKRFYHQLYALETTCRIQNYTRIVTVVYKQPYTPSSASPDLSNGDMLLAVGSWEGEVFLAGEMISRNNKRQP